MRPIKWLADRLIPRRYVEVHGDDDFCVMEPHEAEAWIAEERAFQAADPHLPENERQEFYVKTVWMTRYRFQSLPDFQGY